MDLKFSESDLQFRQEVVSFLETEYPEDIKRSRIKEFLWKKMKL
jgi:hypothetical protein